MFASRSEATRKQDSRKSSNRFVLGFIFPPLRFQNFKSLRKRQMHRIEESTSEGTSIDDSRFRLSLAIRSLNYHSGGLFAQQVELRVFAFASPAAIFESSAISSAEFLRTGTRQCADDDCWSWFAKGSPWWRKCACADYHKSAVRMVISRHNSRRLTTMAAY